jgi:osmotically-inducible protein OsmY
MVAAGFAIALAAGPADPSALDPRPAAARAVDGQQPIAAVRALLDATQAISVFDHVTASADGGVVTLEGKVTSRAKREQLETEVATVPGVRQVVNRVAVLRAGGTDDALRHRVARAIYGHASFRRYAAMSHPPIRVLVEQGRVTLAGEVKTAVERLVARSLAEEESGVPVGDHLIVRA